jgi:hypothetical protein
MDVNSGLETLPHPGVLTLIRRIAEYPRLELAIGISDSFAASTMEARTENQILMCDFISRTRSWLMIVPAEDGKSTPLYFGSVVVPDVNRKTGNVGLEFFSIALLGFHKVYSVLLLRSANTKLMRAG